VNIAGQGYGPVEYTRRLAFTERPAFTEWAGGSPVSNRAVSARRLEAHRDTPAVVPSPLAITAVVVNDFAARTLFCRLPDHLTGPGRIAWANGWQALQLAEENGWAGRTPLLWAATKTAEQVARVTAGDAQMLKCFFEPGNQAYSQLIGRPGLYVIVTADRATRYFLRCLFLHRP
jgi:hypothetical protein